jgi:hypothetical protein
VLDGLHEYLWHARFQAMCAGLAAILAVPWLIAKWNQSAKQKEGGE